ncbi:SigB/SigF/SigG family RNA polymerase sigma factor [Nocardia stercoris]|uniref:SigB/SigF/SigG family RNA polymerase sigma factor n=1 Tax=Nocardia stercoris TaxID=2483361 RepID=A0A3M2L5Q0_9NOCA|nr:SigB/SigF/SigG family RNA polymerase sigma factor [Nocardia stercoris]RMI31205.1 SigB/SigF/SigG family RNA polymerase sigma factor [Nocardia stercoris]
MSTEYAAQSGTSFDDTDEGNSYDNIEPCLRKLASLPEGGIEHGRLRDEIIERCLPLGEHIARRYSGRGVEVDDLTQIAAVGVILSVDRFDPANGSTFLSFAVPTIMGEVKRYFRDSTWAVRVPRRVKEVQQHLAAAISELSQRLGHAPTARELAAHLNVDLAEVTQALIANNCYTTDSLDTGGRVLGGDSEQTSSRLDRLSVEDPGYSLVEESLTAGPLLTALPERQRRILVLRFGENKTQAEIAQEIGVSQMHVSRLLSRTLTELRDHAQPPEALRAA